MKVRKSGSSISLTEWIEATIRGHVDAIREPRAKSARYSAHNGLVEVELKKGGRFAFPTNLAEGLRGLDPDVLGSVQVIGQGQGLRWPKVEVFLSVPDLARGVLGGPDWMERLRQEESASHRSPPDTRRLAGAR